MVRLNHIALEPPIAAAPTDPPRVEDYADHLPMKFFSSQLVWVAALPFLPWEPELVVAPALPTFYLISLFALEALVVPLIADCRRLDRAALIEGFILKPKFIATLFRALRRASMQLSPMASAAVFHGRVRKIIDDLSDETVLELAPADLWATVSRGASAYAGSAKWFSSATWYRASQVPNGWAVLGLLFDLMGNRAHKNRHKDGDRVQVIAAVIGSAFDNSLNSLPLPASLIGNQVLAWFAQLQWPRTLYAPVDSVDQAAEELIRAVRYEASLPEAKSNILLEVFSRILHSCPHIQALVGLADATVCLPILQPLFKELGLPSNPTLEDYRRVDKKLNVSPSNLVQLVDEVGAEEDDLEQRVRLKVGAILQELDATARLDKHPNSASLIELTRPTVFEGGDERSLLFPTDCSKQSMHALRRSQAAAKVVQALEAELDSDEPSRNKVLGILLQSGISAFIRYALGTLKKLEVFDIMYQVEPYTLKYSGTTLKAEHLEPLGIYLGWHLTKHLHSKYPLLKSFRLGKECCKVLATGPWTDEDWEQRLLFDVDEWRMGRGDKIDLGFRRDKELWFSDENTISDLVEPFTQLMHGISYPEENDAENSPAAVFEEACAGFKFARKNPPSKKSIRDKARRGCLNAIRDACDTYLTFISSDSAVAEFPVTWLPASSECMSPLADAMASTDKFIEFAAHLPEVAEKLLGKEEPAEKISAKRGRLLDLDDDEEEEKPTKGQLLPLRPSLYVLNAAVTFISSVCDLRDSTMSRALRP